MIECLLRFESYMSREKVLQQLETAWSELQESFAELSEKEIARPGVVGDWSLKDILGHITTWEEEALKHLPLIARGGTPPRYSNLYGGIHAFNAQTIEAKHKLSASGIRKQMNQTHQRLMDYIRKVPEAQLKPETRFHRRLRQDTYQHYAKHTRAILKWRSSKA